MNAKELNKLYLSYKSHNHDSFFIEHEFVQESYRTIRGLRSRVLFDAPGEDDKETVTDEEFKELLEKFNITKP